MISCDERFWTTLPPGRFLKRKLTIADSGVGQTRIRICGDDSGGPAVAGAVTRRPHVWSYVHVRFARIFEMATTAFVILWPAWNDQAEGIGQMTRGQRRGGSDARNQGRDGFVSHERQPATAGLAGKANLGRSRRLPHRQGAVKQVAHLAGRR